MMIDLLSKENLVNPYPALNRMREEEPVCEIAPGNKWVLTRYDDVCDGLANSELFTSTEKQPEFSPNWLPQDCQSDLFIATIEQPQHRLRRQVITPPFMQQHVKHLSSLMEESASELTEKIKQLRSFDFIHDFAYSYIGRITGNITGLEDLQPLEQTREWVQAAEQAATPDNSNEQKKHIISILRNQKSIFRRVIADRRDNPREDIVSELVQCKIGGQYLTTEQLTNALELLIRSGYQSTVHLLASAVIQLNRRPDLLQQLDSSPGHIPTFIEELLRLYSPIPMAIRHTTKQVTLHGVTLPKDAHVYMSMAAANRDPRKFQHPDEFDLNRTSVKEHIGFGHGPRICLGLHLARLEMKVALEHLLPVIPAMTCPEDYQLQWLKTLLVRVMTKLPINFK